MMSTLSVLRPLLRTTPQNLITPVRFPSVRSTQVWPRRFHVARSATDQTDELLKKLIRAKESKELSFGEIGSKIGRSEVWTAALFYGQAKPEQIDLDKLSDLLGISKQELAKGFPSSFYPIRGREFQIPPSDPLMYRLYEFLIVYGFPLKSIIHEKFGDGIMSAIDFKCDVNRAEEDKAPRVVITLNGKWLPYKRW